MSQDSQSAHFREQSAAERLARETNTPLERVTQIYEIESAELHRTARIKTFVDVLAIHRTRVLLNSRAAVDSA